MPTRRATSFWLNPWAFIRSHRAWGSMLAHSAEVIFAAPSSAASSRAWTFTPMLLWPLDTCDRYP